jgi:hypothetical protein
LVSRIQTQGILARPIFFTWSIRIHHNERIFKEAKKYPPLGSVYKFEQILINIPKSSLQVKQRIIPLILDSTKIIGFFMEHQQEFS